MRKMTFNLIAVGILISLILTVIGVVISFISSLGYEPERPPFKIVSAPPQQTYAVTVERKKLEVNKENPWSWKIYLSYASQGQQVLNEVEVSEGDSSRAPYWDKSPQLNWIYENTFRLDDTASLPESESDVLFVRNDSARALSYLYVNGEANERFFILNLGPQTSLKLNARPQWRRADLSWISASGQFINGGKVYNGQNFKMPNSAKGPGRYCLNVKDDGIMITSLDFEGLKLAEFTPDESKQIEDYFKKLEARQTTQADEKAMRKIYLNRAEIITPRSSDCGVSDSVSSRP